MDIAILIKGLKDAGIPQELIPSTAAGFSYDNMSVMFRSFINSPAYKPITYDKFLELLNKTKPLGSGANNEIFTTSTKFNEANGLSGDGKYIVRIGLLHLEKGHLSNLQGVSAGAPIVGSISEYIPGMSSSGVYLYDPFLSFYENIKHHILYICLTQFGSKPRIIPKPYKIGFVTQVEEGTTFNLVYIIMEKGSLSLQNYLLEKGKSFAANIDLLKKIILYIYKILYLLNDNSNIITEFKHNDFKCNNIVFAIPEKETDLPIPLLIDFGSTQFNIKMTDGSKIEFKTLHTMNGPLYINDNKKSNIVSDMLFLVWSIKYMVPSMQESVLELLATVGDGCNNWILSKKNIEEVYNGIFRSAKALDLQQSILTQDNYSLSTLLFSDSNPIIPTIKDHKGNITSHIVKTPEDVKTCIGLGASPPIDIPLFKNKYLKYKQKYILLKQKSFNL